eukprot:TRINITY_DN18167_c0_g1_i1.p1 TRINITY_DN18167_c0_g1~~TRINITY_DN18167_c0_g1_i1.p1  ORF type:complete len:328 (+),score=34.69 TRINITY_DN18167_c0_g1_i1:240-1223(+)
MELIVTKKRVPITPEDCEIAVRRLSNGGSVVSLGHLEHCILSLHPSVREFESCTPYLLNRAFVEADKDGNGHLTTQQVYAAATEGSHVLIWRHLVRLGLAKEPTSPQVQNTFTNSLRSSRRRRKRESGDPRSPQLIVPATTDRISSLAHEFPEQCGRREGDGELLPALAKKAPAHTPVRSFKPKPPKLWSVAAPRSHLQVERNRRSKKKDPPTTPTTLFTDVCPKPPPFRNLKPEEDGISVRVRAARSRLSSLYRLPTEPNFRLPCKPNVYQFRTQFNPGRFNKFDTSKACSAYNKSENHAFLSATRKEMESLYSSLEESVAVANSR